MAAHEAPCPFSPSLYGPRACLNAVLVLRFVAALARVARTALVINVAALWAGAAVVTRELAYRASALALVGGRRALSCIMPFFPTHLALPNHRDLALRARAAVMEASPAHSVAA